ncbi:MAG TPA: NB-ARC domain-containing protein, partial [Streptosporangiaceae bacterium]|nr:NB-ARC domain-containing protein [Streptosporangiaceae bacterium]
QLMIAQYRCGHVTDVSAAYERYRAALDDETGGEPDALLRTLHFAIARGDEPAAVAAEEALAKRTGSATSRAPVSVPAELPRPADLVGRDDLVAEVTWLLGRERGHVVPVIVISGPGGVGKTALAVRAACESRDRYPDGQLFIELRGTAEGPAGTGEVAAQFLRALGVQRVPDTEAERLAQYRSLLAGRRVLIVLDDARDGWQVSDLAPASPGCAVLVTARQRLPEIGGAHHVGSLEPLGRDDATELFLRVVKDGGISIEDDQAAIGRVVELCGGLPLALKLAGALRVHDHPRPTAELAERLATQGPDAFAYGKKSVARTIGAGFDRLDHAGRRLFLGLGLLPLARFGLWTAAAVLAGDEADSAAALSELASGFMLDAVEPEHRYSFHDLTREYARRRALADGQGDHERVLKAVYRALLTLTRRAHARLYGGDFEVSHSTVPDWEAPQAVLAEVDRDPLAWFEKERLNLRVAVESCARLGLVDLCWDLAVSAHEFYTVRGYFDDWYATHVTALDACRESGNHRGEGIVLCCLNQPALVASRRTESGLAVTGLRRAADLLAASGDRHAHAIALRTLAHALRRQGHLTAPLALFREALRHYEAAGDRLGSWQALRFIGQAHIDQGDFTSALRALDEAAVVAAELGTGRLIAQTSYWTGEACLALGDIDGARAAFGRVADVYPDGSEVGRAYALHGLGDLARATDAYETAERHFLAAAALAREAADAALECRVWLSVAELMRECGRTGEQIETLRRAAEVAAGSGARRLEVQACAALAQVMAKQGDMATAGNAWARVEALYREADLPDEDRVYRRDSQAAAS